MASTRDDPYAQRLSRLEGARWKQILNVQGFRTESAQSFPFPRVTGKLFPYNEFVVVGQR